MTAVDLLLNNASFITTGGGTTTPASGTSEVWTSTTLTAFAAIISPNTECRIYDPAAPSEIIIVTNVSGSNVTVTRGAEGTATVTHAVGHTFTSILTAGGLLSFMVGNFAAVVSACVSRDLAQMGFWRGVTDPGGTASEGDVWFGA